jgi:hypothetical protein
MRRLRLACHHSPQFDTVRPLCPPKPGPDHLFKCSKSPTLERLMFFCTNATRERVANWLGLLVLLSLAFALP